MAEDASARDRFVQRYGGIYEHSPWVAEQAFDEAAGVEDPDELARIFASHVDAAAHARKLALIRAHPDLAEKATVGARHTGDHPDLPGKAPAGARPTGDHRALTEASKAEQSSAGLDQCTPEEFAKFKELNHRYKQKFGFPFIMAVRNSNRHEILAAFEQRLDNDAETEFAKAMTEIHKIARLRLAAVGARHTGDHRNDERNRRSPV